MTRFLFLLLFISSFSFAQEGSKKDKKNGGVGDAAKMVLAKQKLYGGQYAAALNMYREIEKNDANNGTVLYYIGHCYYALKDYAKAKEYFEKAKSSTQNFKAETDLMQGKLFQMDEEFDKAIASFNAYKTSTATDKENLEEADLLLSQCQNAKTMMANPVKVEIVNLGPEINSKYDDKNPCVTADGSRLVFTSRRPETTNSEVDVEGDGKYFEDIFISNFDSVSKKFAKADEVPGSINTKAHDACASISADGKQIFIYKNDINDKESRGGDVFVSKVNNGKWKTPEPVGKPIASSYWEGGACISPDGKRYFFSSERPGGFGASDIWMVERISKKEWGKPVNLGPEVNTEYDEGAMFLAPDGKTLFFCSNGKASMGSSDVFKTVYANGKWTKPVNLGYPVNSGAKDGQLSISADAKYAYISSERKGGFGESDIYRIDLKDYAILEADGKKKSSNGLSILKGTIRDGYEGYGLPEVDVQLTDDAGTKIASTLTNENGEYFFTLKGGSYNLTLKKKGFKEVSEKIELKSSDKETVTLEKGYLLKK